MRKKSGKQNNELKVAATRSTATVKIDIGRISFIKLPREGMMNEKTKNQQLHK